MTQQTSTKNPLLKTLKDTNYLVEGSYKKQFFDYFKEIGISAIISKTILAPIERWRIIQQTQTVFPLRPFKFKNAFDYIQRIPKQQGILAFWRGNKSTIGIYTIQTLFQIGIYDNIKNYTRKVLEEADPQLKEIPFYMSRLILPLVSSFFTQLITFPMQTAKVRISMNYAQNLKESPFKNVRTCVQHIRMEENGIRSVYKGFLLSNLIAFVHFNFYLSISQLLANHQQKDQFSQYFNTDTIASTAALIVVHPLDTFKKILQLNNLSSPSLMNGSKSCYQYLQRNHSWKILYNGITASVLKSVLFLPVFVTTNKALNSLASEYKKNSE